MAGEVGEVVGEQRDGHRVQLDRFDVGRAEVQRREDLLAARGPDDELACRAHRRGCRRGSRAGRSRTASSVEGSPSNRWMPEPNVPSWTSSLSSASLEARRRRRGTPVPTRSTARPDRRRDLRVLGFDSRERPVVARRPRRRASSDAMTPGRTPTFRPGRAENTPTSAKSSRERDHRRRAERADERDREQARRRPHRRGRRSRGGRRRRRRDRAARR